MKTSYGLFGSWVDGTGMTSSFDQIPEGLFGSWNSKEFDGIGMTNSFDQIP